MRINEITAVLADGVLTVTLPKATGAGPQDVRIPVRTPEESPRRREGAEENDDREQS